MIAWFKRQSIPVKIRLLIVGTAGTALLLAIGLLSAVEVIGYRQQLVNKIATLAQITAANATTAAQLEDGAAAKTLVRSLSSEPTIESARLFSKNGVLLAYNSTRQNDDALAADRESIEAAHKQLFVPGRMFDASGVQSAFHGNHLDVTAPIRLRDETIGHIYIVATLTHLYETLLLYAWTTVVIMLAALAIAYAATMRLRDSLSKPLLSLVGVMRRVSEHQDYQARAFKSGNDEVGALVDGFNAMLEQIQERDHRLDDHRRFLERQVAERTAHLERALDGARQASKAKSEFLARMSHEIRTPMNGVLGMTELLRNSALDPRQRRLVDTVYKSGESLLQIINDILDFSKVEAGRMELAHIDFSLRDAVEESCELLGARADAKQLELICDMQRDVPTWINGDPLRLKQILLNLIGNAIKFTDVGDVVVRVIRLPGAHRLRFEVRDSGPGISPVDQAKVFQSFTQADSFTTRTHGGTGLGLAIAQQMVHLMHGEIGLVSEPPKGSTFWFELPYVPADEPNVVRMPRMSLVGVHALVVDDNAINREIVQQYLAGWGATTDAAENGERALARLQAAAHSGHPFDVVILDHKMPVLDGLSCLREMRGLPTLRDTKVILLSSIDLALRQPELEALAIGEALTKPVRQARLYAALNRVLGRDVHMQTTIMRAHAPSTVPRTSTLNNVRALLVEDNDVNREVALGMLAALGCEARVAVDGAQAIEMFQQGGFDVVLMDCNMPVMDGYAATQAIRAFELEAHRVRVPIVALTANALDGGRERCIAAGMDDFLTKPFTIAQLRSGLEHWTHKHLPAAVPAKIQHDESIDNDVTLNSRAIDAIRALRSPDLLKRIIDLYEQRSPSLIQAGNIAANERNAVNLSIAAHELKSSSSNLGGERMARMCKDCEAAARKFDMDTALVAWRQACAEHERFLHALHALRDSSEAAPV
jgi:two-component system sensor histidine kinase/response regulator